MYLLTTRMSVGLGLQGLMLLLASLCMLQILQTVQLSCLRFLAPYV